MRPKFITVPSSMLEGVDALLISGVGCLAFGLTSLTGLIPDFPPNYFFIATGGGFLLLSFLFWTCRLRVALTDEGVSFAPQIAHRSHDFRWSEIQQWYWLHHRYTDTDGDQQEDKKIILVMIDGSSKTLDWPYCPTMVREALEQRIAPSPTQFHTQT
jgi:hypothetical protein